jgi:hypothetical protein
MNFSEIAKWTEYALVPLLMLVQLVTLAKLIRRENFKEGIKMMAMFLLSNLAYVLFLIFNKVLLTTTT